MLAAPMKRCTMKRVKRLISFQAWVMGLGLAVAPAVQAGRLDASRWSLRDAAGKPVTGVVDNDAATGALLKSHRGSMRCVIDLGAVHTIHRVYFTARSDGVRPVLARDKNPHEVRVQLRVGKGSFFPGATVASCEVRVPDGGEICAPANLRFQPVAGRFLVLDMDRGDFSKPWNLGEIEVYGWPGAFAGPPGDAVVVDARAPAPLKLAASELSYYLGELAGHPVPIVPPGREQSCTGTLFRIVDLKPLAATYDAMVEHQESAQFPDTPVNVEREGRELIFRAWPYRNVLWSVWEFLERQGVKWVYPDAQGDFVPEGRGIRLDVAPLRFTPGTEFIYANFGVEYLRDDPDAFLHFWRNRWTHTWGNHQESILGGPEVPRRLVPEYHVKPGHVEGFIGYPHNFHNVIPDRVLAQHPDWCGVVTNEHWRTWLSADKLNRRLPPGENKCTFDLTQAGPREFVIGKAIDWWPGRPAWYGDILWLLPDDALLFSEDDASMRMREPLRDDPLPFVAPYLHTVSGDYYDFVCHVADGLRTELPGVLVGAMAYANTHRPPAGRASFPDNVLVDLCMYGARNLPLDAPANALMKERLEEWVATAKHLRHYDYDLIHNEKTALPLPVPLLAGMADRARYFHAHGMAEGGTQADLDTLPYNPWNYYAYPRFYWNPDLDAATVLDDFCTAFFREAAEPMRAYYQEAERHLVSGNLSLQGRGYDYALAADAYPREVLERMQAQLLRAEEAARYWVTRERVRAAREGFTWLLKQRGFAWDERVRGRH